MSFTAGRRRDGIALTAAVLAALALRLAFRIDHDEDIDALRFALGVERFDVAALRPHAPYYPVFIAAAKLVAALGASARGALAIVSAAAGAATVAFTALLASEIFGVREPGVPSPAAPSSSARLAAVLAGALALASPALWLAAEKLLSDMAGVAVFTAALWLCARARRLAAAGAVATAARARTVALVLLGLGLGVRLSYFPVALACLAVIARDEARGGRGALAALAARAGDLAVGVLAWLLPLVLLTPARELVAITWVQGVGHFTRWGGSAITVSSPAARLSGAAWGLWANALGGALPDAPAVRWPGAPLLALLLAAAAARALRAAPGRGLGALRAQPELWAAGLAYAAWALLGQNTVFKARHWLPLVPLLIVALVAGARALGRRAGPAIAGLLALTWFLDGLALARAHRDPSPAAAIVAHLRDDPGPRRPLLTRDLGRMIEEGAPAWRPRRVVSDDDLVGAVVAAGPAGALITSEALSPAARAALAARGYAVAVRFARPRSRYVDPLWSDLALLDARPPPPS